MIAVLCAAGAGVYYFRSENLKAEAAASDPIEIKAAELFLDKKSREAWVKKSRDYAARISSINPDVSAEDFNAVRQFACARFGADNEAAFNYIQAQLLGLRGLKYLSEFPEIKDSEYAMVKSAALAPNPHDYAAAFSRAKEMCALLAKVREAENKIPKSDAARLYAEFIEGFKTDPAEAANRYVKAASDLEAFNLISVPREFAGAREYFSKKYPDFDVRIKELQLFCSDPRRYADFDVSAVSVPVDWTNLDGLEKDAAAVVRASVGTVENGGKIYTAIGVFKDSKKLFLIPSDALCGKFDNVTVFRLGAKTECSVFELSPPFALVEPVSPPEGNWLEAAYTGITPSGAVLIGANPFWNNVATKAEIKAARGRVFDFYESGMEYIFASGSIIFTRDFSGVLAVGIRGAGRVDVNPSAMSASQVRETLGNVKIAGKNMDEFFSQFCGDSAAEVSNKIVFWRVDEAVKSAKKCDRQAVGEYGKALDKFTRQNNYLLKLFAENKYFEFAGGRTAAEFPELRNLAEKMRKDFTYEKPVSRAKFGRVYWNYLNSLSGVIVSSIDRFSKIEAPAIYEDAALRQIEFRKCFVRMLSKMTAAGATFEDIIHSDLKAGLDNSNYAFPKSGK